MGRNTGALGRGGAAAGGIDGRAGPASEGRMTGRGGGGAGAAGAGAGVGVAGRAGVCVTLGAGATARAGAAAGAGAVAGAGAAAGARTAAGAPSIERWTGIGVEHTAHRALIPASGTWAGSTR